MLGVPFHCNRQRYDTSSRTTSAPSNTRHNRLAGGCCDSGAERPLQRWLQQRRGSRQANLWPFLLRPSTAWLRMQWTLMLLLRSFKQKVARRQIHSLCMFQTQIWLALWLLNGRILLKEPPVAFWPGPLTLVVPKAQSVPDIVTANGHTVALRCPGLTVSRRLIELAKCPIAAPSANRSEAVSPTTAHHVLEGLGHRVGMILDGGPCEHGLESTVLDCTVDPPTILRPGPISAQQLAKALGVQIRSSKEVMCGAGQRTP